MRPETVASISIAEQIATDDNTVNNVNIKNINTVNNDSIKQNGTINKALKNCKREIKSIKRKLKHSQSDNVNLQNHHVHTFQGADNPFFLPEISASQKCAEFLHMDNHHPHNRAEMDSSHATSTVYTEPSNDRWFTIIKFMATFLYMLLYNRYSLSFYTTIIGFIGCQLENIFTIIEMIIKIFLSLFSIGGEEENDKLIHRTGDYLLHIYIYLYNKCRISLNKPILATTSHVNHPYLSNFDKVSSKSSFQMNHLSTQHEFLEQDAKIDDSTLIEVPLQLLNGLPGILASHFHLKQQHFYLIDSGCKYSIINADIFSKIQKTGLSLNKFEHRITLQAHNGSGIKLEPFGVFLPIRVKDTKNVIHDLMIPALIEKDPSTLPILGFDAIKELRLNFNQNFTSCIIRKSGKIEKNYCLYNDACHALMITNNKLHFFNSNQSVIDGDYLVKGIENFEHTCEINHVPEITCKLAKRALSNKDLRNELSSIFKTDTIVQSDVTTKDTIVTVKQGNIIPA